eukprot:2761343-Amphidinium_carterae.1
MSTKVSTKTTTKDPRGRPRKWPQKLPQISNRGIRQIFWERCAVHAKQCKWQRQGSHPHFFTPSVLHPSLALIVIRTFVLVAIFVG